MKPYALKDRRPIAEVFRKMGYGPVDLLVAKDVNPDTISYLSMVFAAIAGAMLFLSHRQPVLLLIAPLFTFFRLYCNMVDGMVAVKAGKCSAKGEVINELPDRISDTAIFLGLALSGYVNVHLVYGVIFGMMFGTYVGVLGKAVGAHRQFSGLMGKQQRMFVLALGCWVQFFIPEKIDLWVSLSVLDFASGVIAAGLVQTIVVRTRGIFREVG